MALFEQFPYANFHELNLDWVLKIVKQMQTTVDDFVKAYATPITVQTPAEMTNANLIYVYAGETIPNFEHGHWYYYNKETNLWADGGKYGAFDCDDALSDASENAVQNKVITRAINNANSNISANTSAIATNTSNIATNTSDITTLKNKKVDAYQLINGVEVNYGGTTLIGNRRWDTYKVLMFVWIAGSQIRASAITPSVLYTLGVELTYVDSTNTQRWANVSKTSDTTARLTASSNADGKIYVYGIDI